MAIDEVFCTLYADKKTEEMHIAQLLADLLAWCRQNQIRAKHIVERAADQIGLDLPDDWCRGSLGWLVVGASIEELLGESYSPPGGEEKEESGEEKAANSEAELILAKVTEMYQVRAAVFAKVLEFFPEELSSEDAAVEALKEVITLFPEPADFFRCADTAERITNGFVDQASGKGGIWYGDEFYAYDELIRDFGDQKWVDRMLREIGYDPTDKPTVSGSEMLKYFEKHLSKDGGDLGQSSE